MAALTTEGKDRSGEKKRSYDQSKVAVQRPLLDSNKSALGLIRLSGSYFTFSSRK